MKSLLLVGLFLVTLANGLWICPPAVPGASPTLNDIKFGKMHAASVEGCLHLALNPDFTPFFVHFDPASTTGSLLLDGSMNNELIQTYLLPFFPTFAVVAAHEEALPALDVLLAGAERQLINLKAKHHSRRRPAQTGPLSSFKLDQKDDVVNSMSESDYLTEMKRITGAEPLTLAGRQITIKTRYTNTQNNKDAAAYFVQRFTALGLSPFYQEFRYNSQTVNNVIGVKRGTTHASEIIVVGAHYDSISQDPQNNAPGCVDNGSGSEGVMLMAKAFANITTSRTIHFILWGVEEQGLVGSNYYVDNMDSNGYNVVYSLIMDMIGYSNQYFGVKVETSSSSANRALADLFQTNLAEYSPSLTITRSTNYFGSDHVPFIDADIPCFLAIEQDDVNYVGYHRTTDQVNYLSPSQSVGIVRGLAATLYDLAI